MTELLTAIVPAAGVGSRADAQQSGLPKQYRALAGVPMLRLTVQALLADPRIAQVRVAVSPGDARAASLLADLPRTVVRSCGGSTRADTVLAALKDAGLPAAAWVLVHDAARPGLPAAALARLIDDCLDDAVGGILALPVADSVKAEQATRRATGEITNRADEGAKEEANDRANIGATDKTADAAAGARIARSVPRNGLWLAQTPQMFRAGALIDALTQALAAGEDITDEAGAMQAQGLAPRLVLGSARNFKVTWPEDFDLMEKWL